GDADTLIDSWLANVKAPVFVRGIPPAKREGPQLPEQSKASKIGAAFLVRGGMHPARLSPGKDARPDTRQPCFVRSFLKEKRLTRVGENSACKLKVDSTEEIPSGAPS
ncbi:MAG: hypothetical protein ABWX85_10185, partial [Arthrobacter sp.]